MKLLHTSDWHLGRSFYRESLLDAQAAFADHLVRTVRAEKVDCVMLSGDVYDRAIPPLAAMELYDETLLRLADLAAVVVISGNHDSAIRLGIGSRLLDRTGVHIRTAADSTGAPVVLDGVAVYPIPYLEPDLVRASWELDERSHNAALTEAMRRVHADGRRGARVVMAHAFVRGGTPPVVSESERNISVGGAQMVSAEIFDGVDYVALGHLHGRQKVRENVRYSGSPLAYSFSEIDHVKGFWLVDIGADGLRGSDFAEAPVPRALAHLTGDLEELLTLAEYERYRDHWVKATLTDAQRPAGAMDRLRRRFEHTLVLEFAPAAATHAERDRATLLRTKTERELAGEFLAEVTGQQPTPEEQALIDDAFTHCGREEKIRVPAQRTATKERTT